MQHILQDIRNELSRYKPDPDATKLTFRFWHVEPLVNQAIVIAERMLSDKRDLQALLARTAMLSLDGFNINADDEREKSRKANGFYDAKPNALGVLEALADDALGAQQKWYDQAGGHLYEAQTYTYQVTQQSYKLDLAVAGPEANVQKAEGQSRMDKKVAFDDLTKPQGPLDFPSQTALIKKRITQDYEDALDRATIAADGIRWLFGNFQSDGDCPDLEKCVAYKDGQDIDQIDGLALWLRKVARTLNVITQREQVYSKLLSLKTLLGPRWGGFASDLQDHGAATDKFVIAREQFLPHAFGRFRGLTAFSLGSSGVYELTYRLPTSALISMPDGSTGQVDQSAAPTSFLGRIRPIDSALAPQMSGTNSLMNLSPFGAEGAEQNWQFTVKRAAGEKALLDDLLLELSLAALPR